MKNYAIDVQNIVVKYGDKVALSESSLRIMPGTICGLVGMNGAGKSTLFKTIMGFVTPTQGTVLLNNMSVSEAQKKGIVSYVPQTEDIDWNFPVTVWDVVMMGRYGFMNFMRTPRKEDSSLVTDALKKLNIFDLKERQIGELSGGQKKRVFLARSLAQGAQIMLLDEPFAGVDAKTEAEVTSLLLDLKKHGIVVLISTHELTSLTEYCDHVAFIKNGITVFGKTDDVFTPANISSTFDGMIHHLAIGKEQIDINH